MFVLSDKVEIKFLGGIFDKVITLHNIIRNQTRSRVCGISNPQYVFIPSRMVCKIYLF